MPFFFFFKHFPLNANMSYQMGVVMLYYVVFFSFYFRYILSYRFSGFYFIDLSTTGYKKKVFEVRIHGSRKRHQNNRAEAFFFRHHSYIEIFVFEEILFITIRCVVCGT